MEFKKIHTRGYGEIFINPNQIVTIRNQDCFDEKDPVCLIFTSDGNVTAVRHSAKDAMEYLCDKKRREHE